MGRQGSLADCEYPFQEIQFLICGQRVPNHVIVIFFPLFIPFVFAEANVIICPHAHL